MGKGGREIRKPKQNAKFTEAANKMLRIPRRRRGSHHSDVEVPQKKNPYETHNKTDSPDDQARRDARREADDALANEQTKRVSESVVTPDGKHAASSTSNDGHPLHEEVQQVLDGHPHSRRETWHGQCALPQSLSKLLEAGINPRGGSVGAARVRGKGVNTSDGPHGSYKEPCRSCKPLMEHFGLKEAR